MGALGAEPLNPHSHYWAEAGTAWSRFISGDRPQAHDDAVKEVQCFPPLCTRTTEATCGRWLAGGTRWDSIPSSLAQALGMEPPPHWQPGLRLLL